MSDKMVRIDKQTHEKLLKINETISVSLRDIVCKLVERVDLDKLKRTRRI